jgi:hypothetical protein
MILQGLADFWIASRSANRKVRRWPGIDRDVQIHRQSGSIEGWA